MARKSELEHFLKIQSPMPDIICIQESFLNKDSSTFRIAGYGIERRDREPGQGGGLATLVKSGVSYIRLPDPTSIEALVIRVKLQSGDVTLANVYQAPDKPFDRDGYRSLFETYCRDAIILGDLNAYSPIFGATRTDARGRQLETIIDDNNMVVLNTGAGTYVRRTGEMSHLDVAVASTNIARIANWYVHDDTLGSDHLPVTIQLHDPAVVEDSTVPRWSYRRADWDGFKAACRRTITPDIIDADVEDSRDRLVGAIIASAEANIPVAKPSQGARHKYVPYWTDQCTDAIKRRNKARNRMQRTRDLADRQDYFQLRGSAQHVVKDAQRQYWRDYCSTLDRTTKLTNVWRTVKSMSGVRNQPTIPTLTENGIAYDTNAVKAELFASKFAAISSDDNLSSDFKMRRNELERQMTADHAQSLNKSTDVSMTDKDEINCPFQMYEMVDALKTCKRKSSPGADRISYELLKQIPRCSQTVILGFFNTVWSAGHLPSNWKEAVVCPLLKADKSPFSASSYRPVALTSTLCKLMEKMVATRLRYRLETNKLFNTHQSGFRKNRSTIDHILRLADDAHKAVHNKQFTLAVMVDLEKAFDLVWHKGLLYKMEKLGFEGNILQFVSDFLSNRSIQVRIGSSLSSAYRLQNGTPQGSAISPFLFLIMINDIDTPVKNVQLSLYADDSAMWKTGRNLDIIIRDIQRYLDQLVKFFNDWGLKISSDKTVAIVFTHCRNTKLDDVKLYVNGKTIKIQKSVKFLGIIFDQDMSWKSHIDNIVERCNKRLNLMRVMASTRWGASKSVLLIVYKALIRSIIDYGSIAYDTASSKVKAKLDVVQSKALRTCCGAMTGTPTSALQVECGQPPLEFRRHRMMADYSLKLHSVPDHPTSSTLDDCWRNHYGKYQPGRKPFAVKVKQIMVEARIHHVPSLPAVAEPWKQVMQQKPSRYLQPLKNKIKELFTDKWQDSWDYSRTGDFYRDLYPIVGYKVKNQQYPRSKDVQLTRLKLGHVRLQDKLFQIGSTESPNCARCQVVEDVRHFLLECPNQDELQQKLEIVCRNDKKAVTIQTVLKSDVCNDIIFEFMKCHDISI